MISQVLTVNGSKEKAPLNDPHDRDAMMGPRSAEADGADRAAKDEAGAAERRIF
jgi:hypothetical protein